MLLFITFRSLYISKKL